MEMWDTSWRLTVTGLAVWRLSKLLTERQGRDGRPEAADAAAKEAGEPMFWAGRAADLACWISVWMSSQTAIWVTCGVAAVFLSWLAACGVSCIFLQAAEKGSADTPLLSPGDEMRARNG